MADFMAGLGCRLLCRLSVFYSFPNAGHGSSSFLTENLGGRKGEGEIMFFLHFLWFQKDNQRVEPSLIYVKIIQIDSLKIYLTDSILF